MSKFIKVSQKIEAFILMCNDLPYKSMLNRLNATDLCIIKKFIEETIDLDNDEFAFKLNRWFLDKPKPKNYSIMWGLLSCFCSKQRVIE